MLSLKVIKPFVWMISLFPLIYMVWQAYLSVQGMPNQLGAEPGKFLVLFSGIWALRFLLLTLMMSPCKDITNRTEFIRLRRMFGLYAFIYALIHFMSYLIFLLALQWQELWSDIEDRPYITVGFLAFILLVPLAITSNQAMIKQLKHKWKKLHQLIYIILPLVIIHYFWLVRSNLAEFLFYFLIAGGLLGYRLVKWHRIKRKKHHSIAISHS